LALAARDLRHLKWGGEREPSQLNATMSALRLHEYGPRRFAGLSAAVTLVESGQIHSSFLAIRNGEYQEMVGQFDPAVEDLLDKAAALAGNTTMLELRGLGRPTVGELQ